MVKPMPDLWYYGRNEQRYGPVPMEEMKGLVSSGNLDATDLVWSPGMADWLPASEVDGLFPSPASLVTSPPPPPPPADADDIVTRDCWHYERQGESCGPVSFDELRRLAVSGLIQPDSLVWKAGMPEWLSAAQVEGLFSSAGSPLLSPPQTTPPAPEAEVPVADDRWHYECQGERCGPMSFDELLHLANAGRIGPDSLTWKRGMADWTPAGLVAGLFPLQPENSGQPTSPSADSWYYGDGEQRQGPVSTDELRQLASTGRLRADDLVWKRGMAEWMPAAEVEGLFVARQEPPARAAVVSADLWYYGDGEQRFGPVSMEELRQRASSGQLRPEDLVWNRGMTEWMAAGEVGGLFPAPAEPAAAQPLPEPPVKSPPTITFREDMQRKWDALAPHLSRAAVATRRNLERFRKFVHRQHLGTRLWLLAAATARGVVRCCNAARPYVVRAWRRKPSGQEVRDWSAAKAQQASERWKRTAPWRSRFAGALSAGLNRALNGITYCWRGLRAFFARSRLTARPREDVRLPPSTPKPVSSVARTPPPMPKPVGSAPRIPPPMPKPARPAARTPPPMPKPTRPAASARSIAFTTVAHEQDTDGEANPRKPMTEPTPVSGPEALSPAEQKSGLTSQPAAEPAQDGLENEPK